MSDTADDKGETKRARRGFGAMSPEKQREIASMGGKAANAAGTRHTWTSEEAREAGRKGGLAASRKKKELDAKGKSGA